MVKTVKSKNKRNWRVAIGVLGILAVLSLVFVLNSSQIVRVMGVSKPAPIFVFNQSKASGWWSAENYNSQASMVKEKDYQGSDPIEKLSVASMNLFKGKKGDSMTACFVMFSYYDYHTDLAKLKAEKDAGASQGGMKFQNVGDIQSSINTPDGIKPYTLTKYELSGPGAETSMKGMSYGWVELNKGYIQVSGVCPTAAELDETTEVSDAISLVRS